MNETNEQILKNALDGDIHAFQTLFTSFQDQLRAYLYRLLASRADAEDMTHDVFIRAFDKLHLYRGDASLKTWVFRIATNLAYNRLEQRKRWTTDVAQQAKALVIDDEGITAALEHVRNHSVEAQYVIKHHIDTCFTCIGKTLPIENQMALLLREIYDFSIGEIGLILDKSSGTVKYLIQTARQTMRRVFDERCALVSQRGACHQCSELNGWFNPKQDQQAALMQLDLVRGSTKYDRDLLYSMRTALVKAIDPLRHEGSDLQAALMTCNRLAMGEISRDALLAQAGWEGRSD